LTQSDVNRIHLLREQAVADPERIFDAFDEILAVFNGPFYSHNPPLNFNVLHFDHETEIAAEVQDKIDWHLFKGQGAPPPSLLYPYFFLTKKRSHAPS
jgi:hypothetical protein